MVNLICHSRDMYLDLIVSLHLTGSDLCEVFFSKIRGMNGHERAYDFYKLVNTANTLNHIYVVEYGKNGLGFKKQHNKMENIWELFHKLQPREERCNLGDDSLISSNVKVISALKKGLKEAHSLFKPLNMAPSPRCPTTKKFGMRSRG